MSGIVTAIDVEITELERRAAALRGVRALVVGLDNGHGPEWAEQLAALQLEPPPTEPPPAPGPVAVIEKPNPEPVPPPTAAKPKPRRRGHGPSFAGRVMEAMPTLVSPGEFVPRRVIADAIGGDTPGLRDALKLLRRQGRLATEGRGAGTRYGLPGDGDEAPPEGPTPILPARPAADPATPTAAERATRSANRAESDRELLRWLREQEQVTVADVAEHMATSREAAKKKLTSLCSNQRHGLRKYGDSYRFTLSAPDDDGAKTEVERRVVAAVREGAPIDEGTLAFHSQTSIVELRSIAAGLLRRSVLSRRELEGATVYELPAANAELPDAA